MKPSLAGEKAEERERERARARERERERAGGMFMDLWMFNDVWTWIWSVRLEPTGANRERK